MNEEIFDEIEQNEEEENETQVVPDTLYIQQANKSFGEIPLALTVPDNLEPVKVEGFTLAWQKVALGILKDIQKSTLTQDKSQSKNLPYVSLRGLLEIGLDNVTRIQSNLSLSQYYFNSQEPQPFAYLDGGDKDTIIKLLRPILNDWITNHLKPFTERENIDPKKIDDLLDLYEKDELLTIKGLYQFQILPWEWNKTGTAQGKGYQYRVLIDYLARKIAGKEIFKDLGPIKRIISSSSSFRTGTTELITNPISLENTKGKFSLVVSLEIVTYPSVHQPLLKIDVSKRRWLYDLGTPSFNSGKISGFIFSEKYSDRCFSYQVLCQKDKQKKKPKEEQKQNNWRWVLSSDFEALRRKLKLPLTISNPQEIAVGKASDSSCQVMLTHRYRLEKDDKHDIKAGVPEIDKLEAFEAIKEIIQEIGFEPFNSYSSVDIKAIKSHKPDKTGSRMINFPTLISAALELQEKGNCDNFEFTDNYLKNVDEQQLNKLLKKNFEIEVDKISRGIKAFAFNQKIKPQFTELKDWIQTNQTAIESFDNQEKMLLVIFYENQLKTEVKLLETLIKMLCGEAIEVMANRLPENTHGPKEDLPGYNLNAKDRSRKRIETWQPIVKQLALRNQRTFCLILAPEYYPDNKHDDNVNKPSTRQALAQVASACVQFLLPIETTKEKQLKKLEDFFHRSQAALKDLLFAHSGYVYGVKEKVDKYLKDIPEEKRAKEIIAITIVRKQKGRTRGNIGQTFLPIAVRLNVETGKCELSCAYEKGERLEITPWSQFADGITLISNISPVKLADKKEARQKRFMEFMKQIISDSVEEGNQPLVMIDSSNCVQLCPWLADSRINAKKIDLILSTDTPLHQHMEQEWEGARIFRIRQDLAPGIIDKKERQLVETSVEDTRKKEDLKKQDPDYRIPSASSKTGLFRLSANSETGCVAYLSVGRKTLQQESRGQSCYSSTEITKVLTETNDSKEKETVLNKAGEKVHQLVSRAPFTGQYPTPNPLEIVVTLRQPEDDPDRLALLVESLRYDFGHYSDWSSLPAPLFFERVVRDYISDFAFEDEEDNEEGR
ncbi:MAG: RNaseH domain-containing protein [Microcoleaceae cyanobacterium MO_207.B10]|nr:RNaseH domain-containing protein [Microcoleaceae cyanobacterium MO_207.B10]